MADGAGGQNGIPTEEFTSRLTKDDPVFVRKPEVIIGLHCERAL